MAKSLKELFSFLNPFDDEEEKKKRIQAPLSMQGLREINNSIPGPRPGDNLWNITKNAAKDPTLWPKLYQENQQIIGPNPNLIQPKQTLNLTPILPKLSEGPRMTPKPLLPFPVSEPKINPLDFMLPSHAPALQTPNPAVGENLFLLNPLTIRKNDNPLIKGLKGIVNAGASIADAPVEGFNKAMLQGGSLLSGNGIRKDLPKITTFTQDILRPALSKNANQNIDQFQKAHPVLGGLAEMGLDTLNPASFIGGGTIKNLMTPASELGTLKSLGNLGEINNYLVKNKPVEIPTPQAPTLQTPLGKPFGPLKVKTPEQIAYQNYLDGVDKARNYLQHDDVLAPFPAGTTLDQAFATIKKDIGVDLPTLAAKYEAAQNIPQGLAERFTPESAKLGRVAGVIPGPKDTRFMWPELKPKTLQLGESPLQRVATPQLGLPQANAEVAATAPKLGLNPFTLSNPLAQPKPLAQGPKLPNPLNPLGLPQKMEPLGNGQKARSFPLSVANSQIATPKLQQGIAQGIVPDGAGAYTPIKLNAVDQQAKTLVDSDLNKAVDFVLNSKAPSALHTATGIRAIEKLQNAGNYEQAVDVSMALADRLTKQGQAISAARIVGSLSPEGILTFASKQVQKINKEKLFGKDVEISAETAESLKKLAETAQNATDEGMKLEASQNLQEALNALKPSSIGKKIATTQTIGQLANPKTQVRNILGNELFYRLERVNKYVATPIDFTKSKLTGSERTVTFQTNNQGGYWDGFLKGAKAGWKNVNPNGLTTQYDLGSAPAFDRNGNAANKFMSFMERSLGAVMKGFDNAAYTRAYNQTVGELATLKAINSGAKGKAAIETFAKEINDNVMNIADQYGKYITFQDNNVISNGLAWVKRGLNKPTGGDFGFGDFILKYPRTPGALIARGLEYSPAGFARSAYVLRGGIKKANPNPREAMLALSRAITGTAGLTGMGYFLADNGVISGSKPKDYDLNEIQRQAGQGAYRVNLSALTRFVTNNFDPATAKPKQDDTLINWDWLQPVAFSLSMGTNINEAMDNKLGAGGALSTTANVLAGGLEGAFNTVAEQPVLQGITRMFQGYDLGTNLTNTLKSVPSSFVPTLSNQIKQATNNTSRVTHDPNPLAESINMAKAKIPGVANTLPPAFDSLGNKKETYQNGGNNPFNVFLNPAFVSKYNVSPEAKKALDIYDETGSATQIPRVPSTSITVSGKKMDLTTEEVSKYQQLLGEATKQGFSRVSDGSSNDSKIKALVKAMDKANADAKAQLLRDRGISFTRSGNTLKLNK